MKLLKSTNVLNQWQNTQLRQLQLDNESSVDYCESRLDPVSLARLSREDIYSLYRDFRDLYCVYSIEEACDDGSLPSSLELRSCGALICFQCALNQRSWCVQSTEKLMRDFISFISLLVERDYSDILLEMKEMRHIDVIHLINKVLL